MITLHSTGYNRNRQTAPRTLDVTLADTVAVNGTRFLINFIFRHSLNQPEVLTMLEVTDLKNAIPAESGDKKCTFPDGKTRLFRRTKTINTICGWEAHLSRVHFKISPNGANYIMMAVNNKNRSWMDNLVPYQNLIPPRNQLKIVRLKLKQSAKTHEKTIACRKVFDSDSDSDVEISKHAIKKANIDYDSTPGERYLPGGPRKSTANNKPSGSAPEVHNRPAKKQKLENPNNELLARAAELGKLVDRLKRSVHAPLKGARGVEIH